jgi:phosphohistidine phosphatase
VRVYLVRHGEALPKEVDPDRGLSEEGRREVQKVAAFLEGLAIDVESVWESGKKRATQTAGIMAAAVRSRCGVECRSGMAPNDPVEPIAEKLAFQKEDIMLVGHMPFLADLASQLMLGRQGQELIRFPAAAVVCLESGFRGRWAVSWVVAPGIL